MFDKIDYLKSKLDQLRPLDDDLMQKIQEKLRIEWTYNSNAIEGNTLTFGETLFFLKEGLTSEGKPLKDYLEAQNHAEAIDVLYDIINLKRPITESFIKSLHGILLRGIEFTYAKGPSGKLIKKPLNVGQYKKRPNHVLTLSGKIHHYTDPVHVKDEMEKLMKWYHAGRAIHPVKQAAIFHYRFVAIHPFDDGNGRMSRLLMNLILMRNGYPPCIIKNTHRKKYLEVIRVADLKSDMQPFIHFVAEELLETQKMIDELLRGGVELDVIKKSTRLHYDERVILILKSLEKKPLSVSQILEKVHQIKRPTLKKDLYELVKKKRIKKRGLGKGTVYYL